jgi:hypothetical protein
MYYGAEGEKCDVDKEVSSHRYPRCKDARGSSNAGGRDTYIVPVASLSRVEIASAALTVRFTKYEKSLSCKSFQVPDLIFAQLHGAKAVEMRARWTKPWPQDIDAHMRP